MRSYEQRAAFILNTPTTKVIFWRKVHMEDEIREVTIERSWRAIWLKRALLSESWYSLSLPELWIFILFWLAELRPLLCMFSRVFFIFFRCQHWKETKSSQSNGIRERFGCNVCCRWYSLALPELWIFTLFWLAEPEPLLWTLFSFFVINVNEGHYIWSHRCVVCTGLKKTCGQTAALSSRIQDARFHT